jgi:HAMP domain-containing protein
MFFPLVVLAWLLLAAVCLRALALKVIRTWQELDDLGRKLDDLGWETRNAEGGWVR